MTIMKYALLPLALLITATLAAACTGSGGRATTPRPGNTAGPSPTTVSGPFQVVRADLPRAAATDVSDSELADLVASDTAFAFDLFRMAAGDENLILSPYSVAAALTMTYAGARGGTAEEMRAALRIKLPDERLHAARNELDLRIMAVPESGPDDERQPFTIRVANSLWGQQGYPFLPEFLALLAENYDAGMNLVDFVSAAEEARQTINTWVEEQTEGRIVDLIPEGVIDDLTRLVLVNAIWFKANWAQQFDPERTTEGIFRTLSGEQVTVPMMHQQGRFTYVAGDGYQALRLPYAGDASMVIIVPESGRFEEIRDAAGPEMLARFRDEEQVHAVDLAMPRFEFRSQLALGPLLEELGIVAAFKDPSLPKGADLTGMAATRELFVRDVVHQAFVKVDEEGTEAAAATAVIVGVESLPPPATVTLDRPFLFFIEHRSTGEVLFMGQVVELP